jgi:hypothetical protein
MPSPRNFSTWPWRGRSAAAQRHAEADLDRPAAIAALASANVPVIAGAAKANARPTTSKIIISRGWLDAADQLASHRGPHQARNR